MIQDIIIPRKGGNQQISYLENFVAKTSPVPEVGFRKDTFFLVKRPGTETNTERKADGDIVGQKQIGSNIYIRDDECKIYRFNYSSGVYTFTKIYNNEDGFTYNPNVKSKAIELAYVNGLEGNAVVSSASGTGNYELVTATPLFSIDDVNKYLYVRHLDNTGVFSEGGGQFKRITRYINTTTVYLEGPFLTAGVTYTVSAGDVVELYTELNNIVVINNIRKDVTDTLSQTSTFNLCFFDNGTSSADIYMRKLYGKDLVSFEGRLRSVSDNGLGLFGSLIGEYEIIDGTVVYGLSAVSGSQIFQENIIAIEDYQKFLLIFSTNSISVIWAISTDGDVTIYGYNQALSGMSLYGPYAITKKEGVPFIVTNRKQIGSIDIEQVSEGAYNIKFNEQGYVIQDLLDVNMNEDDIVRMFSDNETINVMITKADSDKTLIYRYYTNYQWRMPQSYNFKINTVFEKYSLYDYYSVGDQLCRANGEEDLGESIDQILKLVGPHRDEAQGRVCYLQQFVFVVGYYNNPLDFDLSLDLGSDKFKITYEQSTDGTIFTRRHNLAHADGTLGSNILGYGNLGGDNVIEKKLSKIGVLGFKVGKGFCGYYELTMTNRDNKNINIGSIEAQYIMSNPYMVPIKNTF